MQSTGFAWLVLLAISHAAIEARAEDVWLPTPPSAPVVSARQATQSEAQIEAIAGTWFDTSNRANVANLYTSMWEPSRTANIGWTGSVAGCSEGTVSTAWQNSVVTGLNFLRNLAGISGAVSLNAANSAKDQKAALMFSANNQISHTPPSNWNCYNSDAATAAGNSNICLSSVTIKPGCLEQYMTDAGSNNAAAGHRRWILYPQTQSFGSGDVPANGANWSANSLWVFDGNFGTPRPATREPFLAWPSAGYFPYQLVPLRWSFSYNGGNFANASVSVTRGGSAMPVSLETLQNGFGENTIVWYETGVNPASQPNPVAPGSDLVYSITISNVLIGGTPQSFTYQVIVFNPASVVSGVATVTSWSPSSGSGVNQLFTATFNDTAGYTNLDVVNVLINPFLDGRSSCFIAYSRPSNVLYLVNDSGSALLPGMVVNGSGSVANSFCTIFGSGTSAVGSGNSFTLTLNISFNQSTYAKDHVAYAAARDLTGSNSGWKTMGVWRVPSASPQSTIAGVSPSSGSGSTQSFALTLRDLAGATSISNVQVLINSDLNGNSACYLGYVRATNLLYLVNDTNSQLLGPVSPNSGTGSAQNSQCILNGAGTTVTSSGTDLILTVNLTFKPAFAGRKILYAAFQDLSSFNTGWQPRGIWTVQ